MKFACLLLFVLPMSVFAQDDDTIRYIYGLPVTGDDSVALEAQGDEYPLNQIVRVNPDSLPVAVKNVLNGSQLYANWQKAQVEYNRNTHIFWVRFKDPTRIRSYGFNRKGDAVSITEKNAD